MASLLDIYGGGATGGGLDADTRRRLMLYTLASTLSGMGGARSLGEAFRGGGQAGGQAGINYISMMQALNEQRRKEQERQMMLQAGGQAATAFQPFVGQHPELAWALPLMRSGQMSAVSPVLSAWMRSQQQDKPPDLEQFVQGDQLVYGYRDPTAPGGVKIVEGLGGPRYKPPAAGGNPADQPGERLALIMAKIEQGEMLTPGEATIAAAYGFRVPRNQITGQETADPNAGLMAETEGDDGGGWLGSIWSALTGSGTPETATAEEFPAIEPPAAPGGATQPIRPPGYGASAYAPTPAYGPPSTPSRGVPAGGGMPKQEFEALMLETYRNGKLPPPSVLARMTFAERRAIRNAYASGLTVRARAPTPSTP